MCMLTAIYPTHKAGKFEVQLTKLLITDLLLANSERGNRDGVGFLTNNGLLKKWEQSFGKVAFSDEYCDCLNSVVLSPFVAHVRTTSTGVHAKEGAHPFVVGHVAVAHNGTFSNYRAMAKDVPTLTDPDPVDSHVFAHLLAEEVGEGKVEPKHIKAALNKMTGSYALIITDLSNGNIWVVAGGNPLRSKQVGHLHVVNTSDQTLDSTAAYVIGIAKLLFGKTLEAGDTVKLDQYTIYKLGASGLVKVDDAPKLKVPATTHHTYSRGLGYSNARSDVTTQEAIERAKAVLDMLKDTWMSRSEIDMACDTLFEKPWMLVDADMLGVLNKVAQELQRSITVEKANLWSEIEEALILPYEVVGKFMDIDFPWPLNSTKTFEDILARIASGEISSEG